VFVNAHLIINELGVLIVTAEFYPLRYKYISDKEFYMLGKIVIGTVAAIIFINFLLFLIAFILGIIKFLRKCPICTCCQKKPVYKEGLIVDNPEDVSQEEEVVKTPTPPPTPTPPTPEVTIEEVKQPTPSDSEPSEEEEPEIVIPAAEVMVTDLKYRPEDEEGMEQTMAGTQSTNLNLLNRDRFVDRNKVKFGDDDVATSTMRR